jgi:hypothetical protein
LSTKGNLQLLDATFDKPNGICFSLDEKKLYVNESPLGKIYVWDVVYDSMITNKKLFYTIPLGGYADGMKIDSQGNLYCTGPTGVWIISSTGTNLDKIVMTETPSNCAWGEADRKTLYITTNTSIYKMRMLTTGIEEHGSMLPNDFKLFQNYPNPFNPSTVISYQLSAAENISLKVFDTNGKEIDTLVNKFQQPGVYHSTFNTQRSTLSSGVYFYTLCAGNLSQTRKMVIMK